MHLPPAVSYPVTKSWSHLILIAAIGLSTQVCTLAFAFHQYDGSRWAYVVLCGIAGLGVGIYGWATSGTGELQWDGSAWHWRATSPESPFHLALMLDLQSLVLVRLTRPESRSIWLFLERTENITLWADLRRALVYACAPLPIKSQGAKAVRDW
jgi:hypothetical protein